jgi:hypothetical protein
MEIYGIIPVGSIEEIGESDRGYRHVVMDYYNDCVIRFNDVLKVEIRTKKLRIGKQPQSGNDHIKAHTLEAVHSQTARVDTIEERTLEAHPIEERTLEAHRTLEACKAAMVAVPSPTARVKPVEGTGIIFAPMCDNFCFTREAVCDHIKNTVPINNLGDYVNFPSKCFHQGYFNDSDTVYVTAQLY